MTEELVKRIGDEYLNANYSDGQILTHEELNEIVTVTKTGINENFNDIQKIQNGSQLVGNAEKLNGAVLSRFSDGALDNNDNTVPTSQQVKNYIDSRISEILGTQE